MCTSTNHDKRNLTTAKTINIDSGSEHFVSQTIIVCTHCSCMILDDYKDLVARRYKNNKKTFINVME